MSKPKIKATYSLDPSTVHILERTAKRWGVSKSEALRRAIQEAARLEGADDPLSALDDLQRAAALTSKQAESWARMTRIERRAAGERGRRGK